MRRALSFVLALVFVLLCLVSCGSEEDTPKDTEGLLFRSLYNGTCYLAGRGNAEGAEITVPDKSPAGDTVVGVDEYAFAEDKTLTAIALPTTVREIAQYSFSGCTALAEIRVPDATEEIGRYAFSGCTALARVLLGIGVKNIGDGAFFGCNALEKCFFGGTRADFALVTVGSFNSAVTLEGVLYYYSATRPSEAGYYYCYQNGTIRIW